MSLTRNRQRGSILVIVVWTTLFLSLLLANVAILLRGQINVLNSNRATIAGDLHAKNSFYSLVSTPQEQRPRIISFGGTEFSHIDLPQDNTLVTLNSITLHELTQLIEPLIPERNASALAAQIVDWRDPDEFQTAFEGQSEHALSHEEASANRPFFSVGEAAHLIGVDRSALFTALKHAPNTGQGTLNPLAPGTMRTLEIRSNDKTVHRFEYRLFQFQSHPSLVSYRKSFQSPSSGGATPPTQDK